MDIVKLVEDWIREKHESSVHLLRTGYWLKQLNPKADMASIIAAITHDVERDFPDNRKPPLTEFDGGKWDDEAYCLWHGKRSAEITEGFLLENGVNDKDLINRIRELITYHKFGGDRDKDLIKDADSLSFFENNVNLFLAWTPIRATKREVKEKFDYMYNRISSEKAKDLARHFYLKALEKLDKV